MLACSEYNRVAISVHQLTHGLLASCMAFWPLDLSELACSYLNVFYG
jgi:hypothetical protein